LDAIAGPLRNPYFGAGARLRLRPKVMTVPTIVASLLPHHVEHSNWRGSDETAGHTGHRRQGEQLDQHLDCNAGDLRMVARAGIEQAE
jgi:hypothetical protein